MCVTKLGGSFETEAAKVLDRKCVKNEHEQMNIRLKSASGLNQDLITAPQNQLRETSVFPLRSMTMFHHVMKRDSHPVCSRPGRIPDEKLEEHFIREEV